MLRELGAGVTGFAVGERVVTFSATGPGGYASIYVADEPLVVSTEGYDIDPAVAAAVVPNAAMAYLAFANVARLAPGESVLIHGALGGFAAAFPGIARQLGASRVVGTVRPSKLGPAAVTRLPYDQIVDSSKLPDALAGEKFNVIIDPVGGAVRTHSLDLLASGGRLVLAGNASGEWGHQFDSNRLWYGGLTVSGFDARAYIPTHLPEVRPAAEAALKAVAAGLGQTEIDVLPFDEAVTAHQRWKAARSTDASCLPRMRRDDRGE
jgi:NADPH2:quinone reductase